MLSVLTAVSLIASAQSAPLSSTHNSNKKRAAGEVGLVAIDSYCTGGHLHVENLCQTNSDVYEGLSNKSCDRWIFGTRDDASDWCASDNECVGFNFVYTGAHSFGYGAEKPLKYGQEFGTAYFRTNTDKKSTLSNRDCYEKATGEEKDFLQYEKDFLQYEKKFNCHKDSVVVGSSQCLRLIHLKVSGLCHSTGTDYEGLGNTQCDRWLFGTREEANEFCSGHGGCAGFRFVHQGTHSFGYGGVKDDLKYGAEYGTAYFRTSVGDDIDDVSTSEIHDCYKKLACPTVSFSELKTDDDENGPCRGDSEVGAGQAGVDYDLHPRLNAYECEQKCAETDECVAFEARETYTRCELWKTLPTHVKDFRTTWVCKVKQQHA